VTTARATSPEAVAPFGAARLKAATTADAGGRSARELDLSSAAADDTCAEISSCGAAAAAPVASVVVVIRQKTAVAVIGRRPRLLRCVM
jgi:hypothetical protein